MNSTLKDYMDDQQVERVAHIVIKSFEKTTGKKLDEYDKEFALMVTEHTFDRFAVEAKEEILVAPGEKGKVNKLLDRFVSNLSELMIQYIYSKLESYFLFKMIEELENKDS
jgi:hypothetical protein